MRSEEALIQEVEDRNKLRAEVGLPVVSVDAEVQKLQGAELRQDFLDWCNRNEALGSRLEAELLEKERKERGNPQWVPRGFLNGGWAFGSRVNDAMHAIWEKQRSEG